MTDPTGRFVIVYNGEVYNYRELRDELAGAVFREVLTQRSCLRLMNAGGLPVSTGSWACSPL